jgi:YbbR domain-containing protein
MQFETREKEVREEVDFFNRVWRLILNNIWLKALSIVFACFLFLVVRTQQVREFSRTARIKVLTAPNVIAIGNAERVFDVSVRLPESLFSRFPSEEELVGELDLREEKLGKFRMRISRENFPSLDKRYTLTIHDPWVEVELDTLMSKRLPIRAVLQGVPKNGLEIERVIVTPDSVEVQGARKELFRLDTLNTSPVNIENIDKNFVSLVALSFEESLQLKSKEEKVNVQVIVGPRKITRTFKGSYSTSRSRCPTSRREVIA